MLRAVLEINRNLGGTIELNEALSKERELNEIKSRFVSMASHEFRTPLSTVLSSAALLGRYTLTEDQELYKIALRGNEDLDSLTDWERQRHRERTVRQ